MYGFAQAGFPFKLGKFLAAGKAIISSNVGDVGNYLENKKNAILIKPESEEEISNAILFCIQHPQLMESMGRAARATARKYFDTEILSNQLLQILQAI